MIAAPPEKIAVIDIGSNSCRMVIYERAGAALLPYFNEKAMAGLGRGLPETGLLNPEGKANALDTFSRFRAILDGLAITQVDAVATAAVREASDGPAFRQAAEGVLKVPIRVLDGPAEGQSAAFGVAAGFRAPTGLIADLGGSSMELYKLDAGTPVGQGESYLLGPLAKPYDEYVSLEKQQKAVRKILKSSALLPIKKAELYAVGGAWRRVAAVHMALTAYPLGVLHDYRLNRKALGRVLEAIDASDSDKAILAVLQRIAKRRLATLRHATLVLDALMQSADVEEARISAYGLREGIVSEKHVESLSRLIDTTALYFKLSDESRAFGHALYDFIAPIAARIDQNTDTIRAACFMADAGARLHPDHRCQIVFEQVLRAPMPVLSHAERMFTAYAVASRYSFAFDPPKPIGNAMSTTLFNDAKIIGTAMRLGGVYSGRSAKVLSKSQLSITNDTLVLSVGVADKELVSDAVIKRHTQLAGLLGLEAEQAIVEQLPERQELDPIT